MRLTKNQRLIAITENGLMIRVYIVKREYITRVIDDCGRALVKRLVFENTLPDFVTSSSIVEHLIELKDDVPMKTVQTL